MRSFQFVEMEIGHVHGHHPHNQLPMSPRPGGAAKTQPSYAPLSDLLSLLPLLIWGCLSDVPVLMRKSVPLEQ